MKYPPIEPWADPGEPGVERLATVPSAGGLSLHRGVRVRARFFAVRSRLRGARRDPPRRVAGGLGGPIRP